ncbi:AEC family transporter [Dongshaea marina]|uniref:AEC family transporter n=1 Tax=Dongshaea marina TaxID=2047966 RepID=UPI00131F2234|nr:AEC family transporter [Dongshaea marina]
MKNLLNVARKPLVFSPVLGILFSLSGLSLPELMEHSLKLIGGSTSGVSLFALGLIMSSFAITFSKTVLQNIVIKNVIHPLLMMGLVLVFGLSGVLAKEVVLLCAMPTATMTTMFALRYNTLTEESTSATILGTLVAIVTLPVFMSLVHI